MKQKTRYAESDRVSNTSGAQDAQRGYFFFAAFLAGAFLAGAFLATVFFGAAVLGDFLAMMM